MGLRTSGSAAKTWSEKSGGRVTLAATWLGFRPAWSTVSAGGEPLFRWSTATTSLVKIGRTVWSRKSSKLICPQWPVRSSTNRTWISLPTNPLSSTTTGRSTSVSVPLILKKTFEVAVSISSTRVSGQGPPPTRKLAQGWLTKKGAEVRVPLASSPIFSKPPIQELPVGCDFISGR